METDVFNRGSDTLRNHKNYLDCLRKMLKKHAQFDAILNFICGHFYGFGQILRTNLYSCRLITKKRLKMGVIIKKIKRCSEY
uniref:Uncharacterized protein n=1 Tax=Meloidogyne enterolobii TaxID=390850 RepID=A0A6V7WCD5_MELEN|nr:unnamed protein product [Meloidogyne enterolobii]